MKYAGPFLGVRRRVWEYAATLPASRSKVFEHSQRCGNPYYIRGFSLRTNLSEHSETTPNLANGYQDGYQMIM